MSAEDIVGVINTLNLYAAATDMRQWDLFDRVFTEDVECNFGPGMTWSGREALKRDFATVHAPLASTLHITTNRNVVVSGDTANSLSYVLGRFAREFPDGLGTFESCGWYDDLLLRTEAGWRISKRSCRSVTATGNPAVMGISSREDMPLFSLHGEARAGGLDFLKVMQQR